MDKTNSALRYGMVHLLSAILPLYIVNEYPRSGGTWVGQMLARALGVPFHRNRMPSLRPSIMHGHYLNSWGMKNVTVVWRDGRDVMVSWYYHCLFPNDLDNAGLVERVRKELGFEDIENVKENLPAFLEYSFTKKRYPRFSWSDFVHWWHGSKRVTYVRYEDLRGDTVGELRRVVSELAARDLSRQEAQTIADEFSFERITARRPGQEDRNSFLRKGVVGDWRTSFSAETRQVFDHYAGNETILLGYEKDRSWVG